MLFVSLSCQHTGALVRTENNLAPHESEISYSQENLVGNSPSLPDRSIQPDSEDNFSQHQSTPGLSAESLDYEIDIKNNFEKLAGWEQLKLTASIHLIKGNNRQTLPGYFLNHPQSDNSDSGQYYYHQGSSADSSQNQSRSFSQDSSFSAPCSSSPEYTDLPSLSSGLKHTISCCVRQYILGVVNSYKIIEYIPGDSAIPLTISPPPLCTVPSFAQFEILPTPDPKKVIIFLSSTDSLVYDFNPGGGTLEIPDIEFDYLPVRMEVRAPQLTEVFNFVLYSERWIEIFCDYDIQCAVMWEGARPRIWTVVTTGKSNWTRAEHCRIMNKEPVAYFVLDRSPMRWWMGIQNVHGTQNGTHAPLSGTWWRLGRQGSHGCVRNPFAEKFYQLMEVGDRVEVYYRHSEGFNITEINPAWRYLRFDLLEEIEDSSDLKQYVHRASEILMPIYQEKLAKAWQEDSVNCNQTAEYQNHP
ncbi:MAG: hypothetical protein APR63_03245 [Desulfuromonas sp. SDB]|nr:MAG: hypothetical protein APR63_03245 [Desulfuromonas sp. SDB]